MLCGVQKGKFYGITFQTKQIEIKTFYISGLFFYELIRALKFCKLAESNIFNGQKLFQRNSFFKSYAKKKTIFFINATKRKIVNISHFNRYHRDAA